jgi:hypothetical protein
VKKLLFAVFAISALLFTGCASAPSAPPPSFQISVIPDKAIPDLTLTIVPHWQNKTLMAPEGFTGFELSVANSSVSVAQIVWEKSSIASGNQSSSIFIEGQKYIDAQKPASPMIVPPKNTIAKDIYSASQVYYVENIGWSMNVIPTRSVAIVICVDSNGAESFYTIQISA